MNILKANVITSFQDFPITPSNLNEKGNIHIPPVEELGFNDFTIPEAYRHGKVIDQHQSKPPHRLVEYYKNLSTLSDEESIFEYLNSNGVLISIDNRFIKLFNTFGYMVNGVPFRPDLFFFIYKIYIYSDPITDVNVRFDNWMEAIHKYCEGFSKGFQKFDENHFFGMNPVNMLNKIHQDIIYNIIKSGWEELIYQPIERTDDGYFNIDTIKAGEISASHYIAWSYILRYPSLFENFFQLAEPSVVENSQIIQKHQQLVKVKEKTPINTSESNYFLNRVKDLDYTTGEENYIFTILGRNAGEANQIVYDFCLKESFFNCTKSAFNKMFVFGKKITKPCIKPLKRIQVKDRKKALLAYLFYQLYAKKCFDVDGNKIWLTFGQHFNVSINSSKSSTNKILKNEKKSKEVCEIDNLVDIIVKLL